ncbi:MAG: ATP-binding protein [Candidatus Obscuribacterales bacterium]|nr:ATP-binding protein [Candidatus Obscuribacterales bacterium]
MNEPNKSWHSQERLKILERAVQSARNGIVITDPKLPDNPIVYANPAFSELTGYSQAEIVGHNCRFLQGADCNQSEIAEVRSAIAEGRSLMTILRNYRKDGTLFWNELSIAPVHDDEGTVINFIGVQNDITARKESDRRVSEFYSMVSHELRTPLSSVRASLGLIDEGSAGDIPSGAKRLVTIALQNAERLLKLVDDILDFKKMETGNLDLNTAIVEPDIIVTSVLSSLSQLAANADIQVIKQINTRKSLCADSDRILQVLINLIANAIKFSPRGSRITVAVKDVGKSMHFAVTDEGPGIAEKDKEKLFLKFHQLDSSDTRPKPGSGLGLAISKTIVELHGGTIGVDSAVGNGSTFWFILPLVPKS